MTQIIRAIAGFACLGLLSGGAARAQPPDPATMATQYADAARENATLMKQYSWKMRVEMTVDGDTKPAQIYQMRYDRDGNLQKTPLTAPEQVKRKRGIRGAIQKDKIEDFREWSAKLAELIQRYMAPSPGTMMDFYGKAVMSPGPNGTGQMSAGGFLQKDDRVTFWVNRETNDPLRFQFITALEGDRVEGNVEFDRVTGGPQYAARVAVSVPERKIAAKVETFDYLKQ